MNKAEQQVKSAISKAIATKLAHLIRFTDEELEGWHDAELEIQEQQKIKGDIIKAILERELK